MDLAEPERRRREGRPGALAGGASHVREREHPVLPDASDVEVLRELMRANDLSQHQLARATGIAQSTISDVLNEQRRLNRGHIEALARHFGISPAAFLPSG